LYILEYCEKKIFKKRTILFWSFKKPDYNILKTAGSPLGIKHKETKIKKKISKAMQNFPGGDKHPMFLG